MTAELKKSPIAVPEFGPLRIGNDDWQMLVRHTKAFCGKNPFMDMNPSDVCFIIVKEGQRNRMLLLPLSNRENIEIAAWVKSFSKIMVGFGYVKGITTSFGNPDEEAKKSSDTKPEGSDVKLSVELDHVVGRPLYYIIMNRNFEYDVYKTPIEDLFSILTQVTDEPSTPEQAAPPQETERFAYECRDCGMKFRSIGEARRHRESNQGHEIVHLERSSE